MQRIITGFHSIEELLRSKKIEELKTAHLLYSDSKSPRVKKLLSLAASLGVGTSLVQKKELDQKTSSLDSRLKNHRGVLLLFEQKEDSLLRKKSLDFVLQGIREKESGVLFILDGISDCLNMGSIIRSAEQFGLDAVVVPKNGSAGGEEGILKTSAGAASWMNIVEVANLNSLIERLKEEGFWIYAADMEGQALHSVKFPNRVAVVMGSEGCGVSRLVKKNSDAIISIPTSGRIDSLNVSVASGVIMYEIKRQFILR